MPNNFKIRHGNPPHQVGAAKRNLTAQVMDALDVPRVGALLVLQSMAQLDKQHPEYGLSKLDPKQFIAYLKKLKPELASRQAIHGVLNSPPPNLDNVLAPIPGINSSTQGQ